MRIAIRLARLLRNVPVPSQDLLSLGFVLFLAQVGNVLFGDDGRVATAERFDHVAEEVELANLM